MDEKTSQFIEAAARATKAYRSFNKVFCIGAHKTGTTSMLAVFKALGLRVAPQHEGELLSFKAARGDYTELSRYVEGYDAFQDSPFAEHMVFAALDALFPNSRFIMTVREPEEWYRSLTTFHARIIGVGSSAEITRDILERSGYLFPGFLARSAELGPIAPVPDYRTAVHDRKPEADWSLLYNKEVYINHYIRRNETIREYFKGHQHKLLEIDLTREPTTTRIVEFLGLPKWLTITTPKLNQTAAIRRTSKT